MLNIYTVQTLASGSRFDLVCFILITFNTLSKSVALLNLSVILL